LLAHNFLPVADALAACEGLDYVHRCWGGVSMEYLEQYLLFEENDFKEILPRICDPFLKLDDPNKASICTNNIGLVLMWYTKHDLQLSKSLCEELENVEYIRSCKSGAEAEKLTNLQE
jgi:hypothetical protein